MKKMLLAFFLVSIFIFSSNAQEKKMSIGLGIGASPVIKTVDIINGFNKLGFGLNFYANCLYNLNSNISIGAEINLTATAFDFQGQSYYEVSGIASYLAKMKYKFGEARTRFFLGLMIGMYQLQPGEYNEFDGFMFTMPRKFTFGFAPEFGIQIGDYFLVSTSAHFPGKYKTDAYEFSYQIWQFNLGWNINFISKN